MLRHVLVPLDGSALSEVALYHAQNIIPEGSRISLLTVIETPVDYEYSLVDVPLTVVTARSGDGEYNNTQQRIQDYLHNKARHLIDRGYQVEMLIQNGDPSNVITDTAAQIKVDAIVMTTHGRTGFSKWLFGSVTQKVISHMPCPVVVVPGTQPIEAEKPEKAAEPIILEADATEPDLNLNPGLAPT